MLDIKVVIATHKKYKMPDDSIYIPLQVGAAGTTDIGYAKDNTGDNISRKNLNYCELTGLYWAWKNLQCDYLGLVHYRRHFSIKKTKDKWNSVLTGSQAVDLCNQYDVILPKKRNYYIETLYSHYGHTHYVEHLDITREILQVMYPAYIEIFDRTMRQTSGYMFNMFLMQKKILDEYCEWLFHVLFALEKKMNMSELSRYQGRFYGRVSELLFNVWLQQKRQSVPDLKIKEIEYIHMEPVCWRKKGMAFLQAKFVGKKYEGSF